MRNINRPGSGALARLPRLFAALAAAGLVLAACNGGGGGGGGGGEGGDLLETARQDGMRIGIANEPPYGYTDEQGDATGEAPAVAREVLSRMGIEETDFVVVSFGELISGLNADRFDMIAAGMFINEERAGQIRFSDPDYCATASLAVQEGNPKGLSDFQSVIDNDAQLGVLEGAVERDYALSSGVPEGQIQSFQDTPDVFDALSAGRIDAVALTTPTINYQISLREGLESAEPFIPVVDGEEQLGCGGYGFRFQNNGFADEFNSVLQEMKANDEIFPIVEEFGFSQADIEAAKDMTAADLAGENADRQQQSE